MPEGDVLDPKPVARIDQCVIGVTALSKDFGDSLLSETLGHEHCAGHLAGSPWLEGETGPALVIHEASGRKNPSAPAQQS
jgi:hypothetical protein